jgi:hypothetical protein
MIRNSAGMHVIPDIPKDAPNCTFCRDSGYDNHCTDSQGRSEVRFCAACALGAARRMEDPGACEKMNLALRKLERIGK